MTSSARGPGNGVGDDFRRERRRRASSWAAGTVGPSPSPSVRPPPSGCPALSLGRCSISAGPRPPWSPSGSSARSPCCSCPASCCSAGSACRTGGRPGGWWLYGIIAVGGAQLCYFSAVQYLSVGVALLLEYSAPILLIGYHWARNRKRPTLPVLLGAGSVRSSGWSWCSTCATASASTRSAWPGASARHSVSAATSCSVRAATPAMTCIPCCSPRSVLGVGGAAVLAVGAFGLLPLAAQTGSVQLAGVSTGWWLPMLTLILVTGVFSYLSGIIAVRRLGSSSGVVRRADRGDLRGGLRVRPARPATRHHPVGRRRPRTDRHRRGPAPRTRCLDSAGEQPPQPSQRAAGGRHVV